MELRQLRYFIEIIKSQNYSNAAKNLFVTQPTLSWNMTKLQEEIGVKLMYQVGNKVMPTTAGSLLYDKGLALIEELDDLVEDLATENMAQRKELVIGSNAIISPFFMPLIRELLELYPNLTITIEEDGSIKTQKKVANGELEIGIVSFPIVEADLDIEQNSFHTFQYHAYVAMINTHPLAKKKSLSIRDLKNEVFSSMSRDYVLWHVLQNKARESGFRPKIGFMSNSHEVLIQNLLQDHSIALLPIQIKALYPSDIPLAWVPLDDKIKPFDIVVIHKKDQPLSPTAALCLEFLTNHKAACDFA